MPKKKKQEAIQKPVRPVRKPMTLMTKIYFAAFFVLVALIKVLADFFYFKKINFLTYILIAFIVVTVFVGYIVFRVVQKKMHKEPPPGEYSDEGLEEEGEGFEEGSEESSEDFEENSDKGDSNVSEEDLPEEEPPLEEEEK